MVSFKNKVSSAAVFTCSVLCDPAHVPPAPPPTLKPLLKTAVCVSVYASRAANHGNRSPTFWWMQRATWHVELNQHSVTPPRDRYHPSALHSPPELFAAISHLTSFCTVF
eukprot:m.477911 g.477911  ORF g.477911 m.477911 type:complete len:110 (+) comp45221_c0_seq1:3-332(+)